MGAIAGAVGGALGAVGGMISGDAAAGAAQEQAEYLRNLSSEQRAAITKAASEAAARGQFKPVTVTSMFGTPKYTYDESGRLTGVSTTPASWLADLQARQTGLAPQYLGLTEAALSSTPQYARAAELARTGGENLYALAGQALPTSYDTTKATQDYYNRMQQIVAPERERQLATTRQGLFNRGRTGLAIGATQAGGQLATNPEMAAYYNAVAQQDLQLANQAEQQARSNLMQDIEAGRGLYQAGLGAMAGAGDTQSQMYRNIAASQAPFATGMQALGGLEQTAYAPVEQGFKYAGSVVPAEQWAGQIGLSGAQSAANLAASMAPQIANYQYQHSAYSPWGTLLSGLGSAAATAGLFSSIGSIGGAAGAAGGASGSLTMPGATDWTSSGSSINPFQYAKIGG